MLSHTSEIQQNLSKSLKYIIKVGCYFFVFMPIEMIFHLNSLFFKFKLHFIFFSNITKTNKGKNRINIINNLHVIKLNNYDQ